jgi:hypothetical protein
MTRSLAAGMIAFAALLAVYLRVLTLVSGWTFTASQFAEYWYYLLPLSAGFGAQVGLYTYLQHLSLHHEHCRSVVAASGSGPPTPAICNSITLAPSTAGSNRRTPLR